MLDQETGLRAWLATGDPQFLGPYRSGKAHTETAVRKLIKEVRSTPDLADGVVRMLLMRQRWQDLGRPRPPPAPSPSTSRPTGR